MRQCIVIFLAPAPFRKHLALAQQHCPCSAAVDPDIMPFSSIRSACIRSTSTKDGKKECAYDPGALNKQGALKNQTIRYNFLKYPKIKLYTLQRQM